MKALVALAILTLTGTTQGVVLTYNATALHGHVLVVYVAASLCYFIIHWAEPYIEELSHLATTKYALMALWVWTSLVNEVVPHVPAATNLASMAFGDLLPLITLSASLAVVEALGHVQKQAIALLIRLSKEI